MENDGGSRRGMSLRDWFAGQVLVGLISIDDIQHLNKEVVSINAYVIADAMIAERSRHERD